MIEQQFARVKTDPYTWIWTWEFLLAWGTPWHCHTMGCCR